MAFVPVSNSTNIEAYNYDSSTQELKIQFRSGKTYTYTGVPSTVIDQMLSSGSIGKFLASNVFKVFVSFLG